MFTYTENTGAVATDIPFEPSAVAMSSLRKGHFVPLYNFHPAMCRAAFDKQSISMSDTLSLQVDGGALSLVRNGSLPAKHVVKDSELTFEEFELASAGLVAKMKECTRRYSPEVTKDVYLFFHKLIAHKLREKHLGNEALLLYAAHTRQHWHACFASATQGGPGLFRLSVINEANIKQYHQDLMFAHRE